MLGITKEQLMQLPEVHYPGKVILVNSAAKARDALAYLNKVSQVGFDTETRPSFQKNHRYKVSLVQISTLEGECFLFRLKEIGSLDELFRFFENEAVQKIGLSLKDDFHSLQKLADFTPAGFVELQTFVKDYKIADNSLQKIYAVIFNERISKNQRLTNWEAKELTPGQQAYAAIDAWACQKIYNHLIAGEFNPDGCPYEIDDETAEVLQRSVGIHVHHEGESQPGAQGTPAEGESDEPKKKKKRRKKKKAAAEETPQPAAEEAPAGPAAPAPAPAETPAPAEAPKKTRYRTHTEEIAAIKERLEAIESVLSRLTGRLEELTAPKQASSGRRRRKN